MRKATAWLYRRVINDANVGHWYTLTENELEFQGGLLVDGPEEPVDPTEEALIQTIGQPIVRGMTWDDEILESEDRNWQFRLRYEDIEPPSSGDEDADSVCLDEELHNGDDYVAHSEDRPGVVGGNEGEPSRHVRGARPHARRLGGFLVKNREVAEGQPAVFFDGYPPFRTVPRQSA